jgi:phosphomannomutase
MKIDPSIFKAYDIRGIYPDQLNEEIAYKIGRAYAEIIKSENPSKDLNIVVGCDMRLSTPSLKEKVIQALLDSGVNVIDAGFTSTPTYYFAVAYYGYDGGMQVSASHNPKEYNGFKLTRARAVPISGDTGMYDLRDMVIKEEFPKIDKRGTLSKKEGVLEDLVKEHVKGIDLKSIKPFKIVADAANAMGAIDIEAMFKGLPIELIKLNFKLDGNFPAHQSDPLQEKNLVPTQEKVKEEKADMGIVPDGDGDRYFFIDENGEVIRQEILRGIMAQLALKRNPGATVCYDIRPGRITKDMIEAVGGNASVTRVGHSLIKEQMIKENAVFGGESSGHYFYKFDYGTFESPVKFVLSFLEFISKKDKPLSKIIKPYKVYFHSGEINSKVKDVKEKIKEIEETYKDAKDISHLDGVTIEYDDFWFNVRPSNTEPLLRLNLEAKTKKLMEEKRDEVLDLIRK